ncbi:MAG: 4-(cytidine 5'-diphospho)-2-C-methyl-D-erythritol kinase [Lachnospiraceae bacterium]|nr:4-(cytidine 5'-diphospho)-2-C-methyl-D-erythritol kinase [Lachnospiraceae bacterium]
MITRECYAKINLSLDVTGRRPDGYHEVRMIMASVGLHDTLKMEFTGSERVKDINDIHVTLEIASLYGRTGGEIGEFPIGDDNLIVRAAKAVMSEIVLIGEASGDMAELIPDDAKGTIKITLDKRIPMAAGLAGGSTDAAAALIGVNELFGNPVDMKRLSEIGAKLGADIPYCMMGGVALAEGIGEVLTPIECGADLIIALAKPESSVSTPHVYKALDAMDEAALVHPDVDGMREAVIAGDTDTIVKKLGNILEYVTIPECPDVRKIKDIFMEEGARAALMSGSGPTVFAICDDRDAADRCVRKVLEAGLSTKSRSAVTGILTPERRLYGS